MSLLVDVTRRQDFLEAQPPYIAPPRALRGLTGYAVAMTQKSLQFILLRNLQEPAIVMGQNTFFQFGKNSRYILNMEEGLLLVLVMCNIAQT